jgi:hypothetical protein
VQGFRIRTLYAGCPITWPERVEWLCAMLADVEFSQIRVPHICAVFADVGYR